MPMARKWCTPTQPATCGPWVCWLTRCLQGKLSLPIKGVIARLLLPCVECSSCSRQTDLFETGLHAAAMASAAIALLRIGVLCLAAAADAAASTAAAADLAL